MTTQTLQDFQTFRGGNVDAATADNNVYGPKRRLSEAQVLDAAQLMGRVFKGDRYASLRLAEALSTDDFRAAAFEVIDREMLQRYQDLPATWTEYARRATVRDFKPKKLVDLLGGRAGLEKVPELTEYPARDVSKALYELTVAKYGGRFQISWEAGINDELGEIQEMPNNLAVAARDTEARTAAGLLTAGSGPNAAYFNATAWGRTYNEETGAWSGGSSNLLAGNPALTVDSLTSALNAIAQRRDLEGRPILVQAYKLVVPPSLEFTARKILDATEIWVTQGSNEVHMRNWVSNKVQLVVDPWLPVLDLGANAATTWYLLPDPASSRPALHLGFLRGHETPDLRVKADAGNRIGGGAVNPEEGSFDVDDIQYRVRHVVGATGTDMIATAVSNGSNA
jgi:hypothetical protein